VCADWGVSRSKGYAIIKQLSDQMKAENPELLTMAGKGCIFHYEFEFIHPFADGNGRTGRLFLIPD
jgi:Fic family protein